MGPELTKEAEGGRGSAGELRWTLEAGGGCDPEDKRPHKARFASSTTQLLKLLATQPLPGLL